METLQIPSFEDLERFFDLVAEEQPALLPTCRWLVLGPRLARLVMPEVDPAVDDLASLLRLLRDAEPSLLPLAEKLVRVSDHGEAARIELCVDQLLAHDGWNHPTQVLERPRPELGQLLAACRVRLEQTPEQRRQRVLSITVKVERAARIAEEARKTRQRLRRKRR